jgi:predicted amidohydrolase
VERRSDSAGGGGGPSTGGTAYRAVALQLACHAVNALGVAEARDAISAAVGRVDAAVGASVGFLGRDVRLVVLPEYLLTGYPVGDPVPAWAEKAALAPDGREETALAAVAQRHGIFLAVNAYETDRHFPGLYFQSCLVFSPSGDTVLRYRRLHSLFSPSPYDVWDAYLDAYGLDGVLPVARTEIGALAAIASEEILSPELARALALRGAEVFAHPTSEASGPALLPKRVARLARAVENAAYVVSANAGGHLGTGIPADSTNGWSSVVDPGGLVLAEAGQGESMVANAELDLGALRRARARPGMGNLLARVKTGLWAAEYGRLAVEVPNGLDGGAPPDRSYFLAAHIEALGRLRAAGVVS